MPQNPGSPPPPLKGTHLEQYYVDFLFGSKIRGCCGEFSGTLKRREDRREEDRGREWIHRPAASNMKENTK